MFLPRTILFSLRPNASQVVFSTQISKVRKSLRVGETEGRSRGEDGGGRDEADLRLNESAPGTFLCAEKKKNATEQHLNVRQAAATFVLHLRFDALQNIFKRVC